MTPVNTIGIVEDDPAVLRFLASLIDEADDLTREFAVSTVAEARAAISNRRPALCLVDLGLPDGNGLDIVRETKARGGKALVSTVLGDRSTVMKVLKAGADGYIIKSMGQADILTHIRSTLAGFTPVSPQVATYLLELLTTEQTAQKHADATGSRLSPREAEVLAVFCRGLTYEETAHALGISINTVRDFVKKIYAKLDVSSRSEAMFEAQQRGLLDPERH